MRMGMYGYNARTHMFESTYVTHRCRNVATSSVFVDMCSCMCTYTLAEFKRVNVVCWQRMRKGVIRYE